MQQLVFYAINNGTEKVLTALCRVVFSVFFYLAAKNMIEWMNEKYVPHKTSLELKIHTD